MGKKYKHLFDKITNMNNIILAYKKTINSKNFNTSAHFFFRANLTYNLKQIQSELQNMTYEHGKYKEFYVYEPKKRMISALPFRDRIVQHAINNIIEPIFEEVFYPFNYACRNNKGVHKGVKDIQSFLRHHEKTSNNELYYLKMDFEKYFASINRPLLYKAIERKITDKKVIELLYKFHPKEGTGIPIGNLLSQLFANVYGHEFDRYVKEELKMKYYYRYMDDTVIFHEDKEFLIKLKDTIETHINSNMKLAFSKYYINPMKRKLNFIGFRFNARVKFVRKDSIHRARRKIIGFKKHLNYMALFTFIGSWGGHIGFSDSNNIRHYLNRLKILTKRKLKSNR